MAELGDVVDRYLASTADDAGTAQIEIQPLWNVLSGQEGVVPVELGLALEEAMGHLHGPDAPELDMRPGGWTINASGGLARTALCAVLLTGLLVVTGVSALSPAVLPAVLPLLFDVQRVQVTAGHRELLARLIQVPGIARQPLTPEQLREMLPASIQHSISILDLGDFLEQLHLAGLADRRGDSYILREFDQARFRVTWQ